MRVSATTITAFIACHRQWWHEHTQGKERVETAAMKFGTELHRQLELWLKEGLEPEHPLARLGIPHLPAPQTPGVYAEKKWTLAGVAALPITGTIDVLNLMNPRLPRIIDHKFRGDMKYALNAEQLPNNLQLNLYAFAAAMQVKASTGYLPSAVEVTHLSYQRRGRALCERATTILSLNHIQTFFQNTISPAIDGMIKYAQAQTAEAVPGHNDAPNNAACRAYSGCPHRNACAVLEGGTSRLFSGVASTTEPPMPTIAEIQKVYDRLCPYDQQALLSGCSATDLGGVAASSHAELALDAAKRWVDAPAPEELGRWLELLEDNELPEIPRESAIHADVRTRTVKGVRGFLQRSWGVTYATVEQYEETRAALDHANAYKEPSAEWAPPTEDDLATHSGVIVPLDAPPNAAPVPPDPKEELISSFNKIGGTTTERIAKAMGLDEGSVPTTQAVADWLESVGAVAGAKLVKGLSAAKAWEILESVHPLPAPAVVEEPPPSAVPSVMEPPALTQGEVLTTSEDASTSSDTPSGAGTPEGSASLHETFTGFTLLVDCIPCGEDAYCREPLRLETLIRPLQDRVEKAHGVSHYSLIDYGKGPHEVAALLRAAIKSIPEDTLILVDSRLPAASACIEVLSQHAALVVRGVAR